MAAEDANQDKEDEERFVIMSDTISSKEINLIKSALEKEKSVTIDYISLRMPDGNVIYHGIYYIEKKQGQHTTPHQPQCGF